MVYVKNCAEYMADNEVSPGNTVLNLSGIEFRRCLQEGLEIPEWLSYPKVVAELREAHPPRYE
jgi:sulfate adenylyltransferase